MDHDMDQFVIFGHVGTATLQSYTVKIPGCIKYDLEFSRKSLLVVDVQQAPINQPIEPEVMHVFTGRLYNYRNGHTLMNRQTLSDKDFQKMTMFPVLSSYEDYVFHQFRESLLHKLKTSLKLKELCPHVVKP